MKKLFILVAAVFFGLAAQSQDSTRHAGKMHKMKDCYVMQDGSMMLMMDGKMMAMENDTTLGNGTMVMKDGTVKKKDGTTRKLENGECVYMNGKIAKMKMKNE